MKQLVRITVEAIVEVDQAYGYGGPVPTEKAISVVKSLVPSSLGGALYPGSVIPHAPGLINGRIISVSSRELEDPAAAPPAQPQ